uniref:Uncharacterized protein n=1 Tax=Rhizophora mucronata TaxID=61149 RepID=A0A2P2N1I6_RHIMU
MKTCYSRGLVQQMNVRNNKCKPKLHNCATMKRFYCRYFC